MVNWPANPPGDRATEATWKQLQELAAEARELNRLNGELIHLRMSHNAQMLRYCWPLTDRIFTVPTARQAPRRPAASSTQPDPADCLRRHRSSCRPEKRCDCLLAPDLVARPRPEPRSVSPAAPNRSGSTPGGCVRAPRSCHFPQPVGIPIADRRQAVSRHAGISKIRSTVVARTADNSQFDGNCAV